MLLFSIYTSTTYLLHSSLSQAISQYLPRGDLRLRPAIYEMILHEFLKTDYEVCVFHYISFICINMTL